MVIANSREMACREVSAATLSMWNKQCVLVALTRNHWVHDHRAYRKDDVDGGAEGTVVGYVRQRRYLVSKNLAMEMWRR